MYMYMCVHLDIYLLICRAGACMRPGSSSWSMMGESFSQMVPRGMSLRRLHSLDVPLNIKYTS